MKESSDTFILFFYLILIIIEKKKKNYRKILSVKLCRIKCYSKAFLNSLIELKRVLNRVAEPSCYIGYTLSNNLSH